MVRKIIRQCAREGSPLPKFIKEQPDLTLGLGLFYEAYWDLDSDRGGSGFGVGRIRWSAIADYTRAHGFEEEQADALFYLIKVLDSAYLKYHAAKSKTK